LTLFSNSTKRNRDIAARPALPYGVGGHVFPQG
jgi:hypothetical protein